MQRLLMLLAALAALPLHAQDPVSFFADEYVVVVNSLNLREKPDVRSKKVAGLPQGTLLQFVESWNQGQYVMADTTDENSPYGRWLKVKSRLGTGWVFDAYVKSTFELYFEDTPQFNMQNIPPLYWYGVYARDSFADELRPVQVKLAEVPNDFFDQPVKSLKTNQKDPSKFLVASYAPLPAGYCGPLGIFDTRDMFANQSLSPGNQLSIHPGNDLSDTLIKPAYGLAATGCARFENYYVRVTDYKLQLLDYSVDPVAIQDLSGWVRPESAETNPAVDLLWFGDLDRDNKPDAIIQDCPYEVACRASLFLSSKARPGEYLRKVCEFYWPGD